MGLTRSRWQEEEATDAARRMHKTARLVWYMVGVVLWWHSFRLGLVTRREARAATLSRSRSPPYVPSPSRDWKRQPGWVLGLGSSRNKNAFPPPPSLAPPPSCPSPGRPVCYPLAALAPGLTWPPDVDGGCREQWLGADDWAAAFGPIAGACGGGGGGGGSGGGLSYQEFVALPAWRRNKLKQVGGGA